jgi:protein O-mannosyl-transferase
MIPEILADLVHCVLIAPLAVLVAYLASVLPYPEASIQMRGFSGIDRLITQMGILWKYLYLGFLPHASGLGPYHDDYQVQRSLFNAVAHAVGCALGWRLFHQLLLRKKAPLLRLCSCVVPSWPFARIDNLGLELYYEHRNYLPLVGPVYALVASVAQLDAKWHKLACAGAAVYAGCSGAFYSVQHPCGELLLSPRKFGISINQIPCAQSLILAVN